MRYMKGFIFLIGMLIGSHLSAGTTTIHGEIKLVSGTSPSAVYLKLYSKDGYMDTASIHSDGIFNMPVAIDHAGLYTLRFGNSVYDLILSPAETEIYFSTELDRNTYKNIQVSHSSENMAYQSFISVYSSYDGKLKEHFINCESGDSCEKVLHRLLTEYADALTKIQVNYNATYTADVLCKMKMPDVAKDIKSTAATFRKGYFQQVDFSDESLLNTPVYKDMIKSFASFLIEPLYSKQEQFVSYLMDRAKTNPVMLNKTAVTLFDELYKLPREKMLGMFITWYKENKAAVNDVVLETKIQALSKVMPGQTYTNIMLRDTMATLQSLKDMVVKSKCTMVLFWSSECSHCKEEMPQIKELYGKYHSKGFNIYAVSVDYAANKWQAYLREQKLPWVNVYNTMETNPNPGMQYMLTSTPTIILIDRNGVIVHRFTPKNKLEKYVQEALN